MKKKMENKLCLGPCGCELPLGKFRKTRNDSREDFCMECVKQRTAEDKAHKQAVLEKGSKVCTECKVDKAVTEYERVGKIGFRNKCKKCHQAMKTARCKEAQKDIDRDSIPKPDACKSCHKTEPEVKFRYRSDVRGGGYHNICNVCFNAKAYYSRYRLRQLLINKAAYHMKQAAYQRLLRERHPEMVKVQKRLNVTVPRRKFLGLKTYLRSRYADLWKDYINESDQAALESKYSEPCHYCGRALGELGPDDIVLNGLDRIDPDGMYSAANTVPCCATCNFMKRNSSIDEFVTNVRNIVAFHGTEETAADVGEAQTEFEDAAGEGSSSGSGIESQDEEEAEIAAAMVELEVEQDEREEEDTGNVQEPRLVFGGTADRRASIKHKKNELTFEQRIALLGGSCYMCGRSPAFGIDRVDSNVHYTIDNCKSCCTACNYIKKDWELELVLAHVRRIAAHMKAHVVQAPHVLTTTTGERHPVAAMDPATGSRVMIFPSVWTAAKILQINADTFRRHFNEGKMIRGFKWRNAPTAEYICQKIEPDVAQRIIRRMVVEI